MSDMNCVECSMPIYYEGDPKRFGEEYVTINGCHIHVDCIWRWMVKNYRTTRSQAGMMICPVCGQPIDRPGDFDKDYFEVNGEYIHDNGSCFFDWLNEHKKERHCSTEY